jgi:hypothetical protein
MADSTALRRLAQRLHRAARRRVWPPAPNSRWFPGQWVRGQRSGWLLADGERWEGADDHVVDLRSLAINPPTKLMLSLILDQDTQWTLEFDGLSDMQIDGELQYGLTECGWEVMGMSMLFAEQPRQDRRVVYMLELPTALMCFASFPATRQGQPAERLPGDRELA